MPMQMRKAQKIKQILPLTNGLFTKMNYTFPEGITKANLDLIFLSNYGLRNPSPVVELIQGTYGQKLTSEELTQLAGSIVEMYSDRWDKLSGIYNIEYDPIHNYLDEWEDESEETLDGESSKTETGSTTYGKTQTETIQRTDNLTTRDVLEEDTSSTRTDDLTKTETRNLASGSTRTDNLSEEITYGKTDTRTDNLSESKTYGRTDTRTDNLLDTHSDSNSITDSGTGSNNVYAFNSVDAVPTNSSASGNTHTETLGGTVSNTGTQQMVASGSDGQTNTGTQTHASTGKDERDNTGTRTLSGTDTGTVTTADEGTESTVGEKDSTRTITNTGTRTTGDQLSTGGIDSTSKSISGTEDATTNRDRSGRHFGNIGNLTSQKMILEEINLWKWNYMQEILSDVKEFCTLPVYLNASEYSLVDQDEDDE